MPNASDTFFTVGIVTLAATIMVSSGYETEQVAVNTDRIVNFTYDTGYRPNATAFRSYILSAEDDDPLQKSDADSQRTAIDTVVTADPGGIAQLSSITVSNYPRLTDLTLSFSPTVPGTEQGVRSGTGMVRIPAATEVIVYYGLLCIIQAELETA